MSESTGIKFITATSQTTAREPRKWKDMTATSILFGFGFNTNILWIQPISIKGCKQTLLLTLSLYNFSTSTDVIQLTLTLKMTTAQVVETSVTVNDNSPIQDYVHADDQTQPIFVCKLSQLCGPISSQSA